MTISTGEPGRNLKSLSCASEQLQLYYCLVWGARLEKSYGIAGEGLSRSNKNEQGLHIKKKKKRNKLELHNQKYRRGGIKGV